MRRWLAILLLTLLPTQMTWAVVAGYCAHESGAAADHVGHHEHASHSHGPLPLDARDSLPLDGADLPPDAGSDARAGVSHDCGHCHGQYASMPIAVVPPQLESFPGARIPPADEQCAAPAATQPERPKWARLA